MMQPLASTIRHSGELCAVHVATLEAPLKALPLEVSPEPERKEFGQHGLRQTAAAAAVETPLEVLHPSLASRVIRGWFRSQGLAILISTLYVQARNTA